jgi:GTPase
MYFMTQAEIAPPTFVFFINRENFVTRAYENFLRNRIREDLGLPGIPVRVIWREKGAWKKKVEDDAAAEDDSPKLSRRQRKLAKSEQK